MDKFFKITDRGSSVATELMGGFTTFLAMAYIIAVNPPMMAAAGIPLSAALTSTCFGAAAMCLLMGLVANRPIALASGMGINAIVAYTLCGPEVGADWRVAMGVIFVEGIAILLLVLCGLRKAIMDAIPVDLRHAICIGIGLFIAFIGFEGGGVVVANESTLLSLGDISSPQCMLSLISIAIAGVLSATGVKFSLVISIIASVIIGIPLGVTPMPESWTFGLDFSAFAAPFQVDPNTSTLAIVEVFTKPLLLMFAFSLLMSDFFDTMGGIIAIGRVGGFSDEEGNVEDTQKILIVDSIAAAFGGFVGASSITTFAESVAGAAQGARTGLSNIVVAALFVVFAFFSPLVSMVTSSATCGALTMVGVMIVADVVHIDWSRIEISLPAFLIIATIPFTYSITNGIGLGFIAYVILMVAKGCVRQIKPLMWFATAAFLVMFLL